MKTIFLARAGVFAGLFLLCQAASAAIIPAGLQINVYGGVSYANGNTSQSRVIPNGYLDDELDARSTQNNGADFMPGIGIAYNFQTSAEQSNNVIHDFSLGLDLLYVSTSLKGQISLYGDPSLNYYDYKLNLNSTQLLIDTQLNFHPISKVMPFVLVGIGAARIQDSYNDSLSAVAPSYVPTPGYVMTDKTNYNPIYAVGAGLQIPVSKQVNFSIRYLYTDLGSVETGGGSISNGSLVTPVKTRVHTQAALAGFTYTFA